MIFQKKPIFSYLTLPRTLINQLVSSILRLCIAWLMLDQIPTLVRFWMDTPFPFAACAADLVFRNSVTMQVGCNLDPCIHFVLMVPTGLAVHSRTTPQANHLLFD